MAQDCAYHKQDVQHSADTARPLLLQVPWVRVLGTQLGMSASCALYHCSSVSLHELSVDTFAGTSAHCGTCTTGKLLKPVPEQMLFLYVLAAGRRCCSCIRTMSMHACGLQCARNSCIQMWLSRGTYCTLTREGSEVDSSARASAAPVVRSTCTCSLYSCTLTDTALMAQTAKLATKMQWNKLSVFDHVLTYTRYCWSRQASRSCTKALHAGAHARLLAHLTLSIQLLWFAASILPHCCKHIPTLLQANSHTAALRILPTVWCRRPF